MHPDHLKLFVRIAHTASISKAGAELGLSPAVASSQLGKLEASLGVRLLHRTTRQVSLTDEGRAFLPHAQTILDDIDTAYGAIGTANATQQTLTGHIRLTASASFGRLHLVPALASFLADYPNLTVDMHLSDAVVNLVEGGFDLAIRDATLHDSSFIARKLAPVTRLICASPDYLKMHGTPTTPQDLTQHTAVHLKGLETWIFANTQNNIKSNAQKVANDVGDDIEDTISIKVNSKLVMDNGEAVRDAGVASLGVIMNSRWCCHEQIKRGELVPILTDYPLASHTNIWAVYPSSRLLTPKVRALIDHLLMCFGDGPYWQ